MIARASARVTLGQLGRSPEELEVYDDIVAHFDDAPEAGVIEVVSATRELKAKIQE